MGYPHVLHRVTCGLNKAKPKTKEKEEKAEKKASYFQFSKLSWSLYLTPFSFSTTFFGLICIFLEQKHIEDVWFLRLKNQRPPKRKSLRRLGE